MKKLLMIIVLIRITFSAIGFDFTGVVPFENMVTGEYSNFNFDRQIFTNESSGYKSAFQFFGSMNGLEVYRNQYFQIAIISVEGIMLLIVSGEMLKGDVVIWKSLPEDADVLLEEFDNEL